MARFVLVAALAVVIGVSNKLIGDPQKMLVVFGVLGIPFMGFLFIRKKPLWLRIFVALVAGLGVGITASAMGAGSLAEVVKPIGTCFIRLISMLIVPLVFATLVVGVAATDDIHKLGRIGGTTFAWYLGTTAVAISIGLLLGTMFQPGAGVALNTSIAQEARSAPSLVDTLLTMIPTNPLAALAEGNILQIIVFALLMGVAIMLVGEPAKPLQAFFCALSEVMFRMTSIVMEFAPYGVYALITAVAAQYGLDVLLPLAKVILLVYVGCILHSVVVYGSMIRYFAKMSPLRFFHGAADAMMVAFTTTSSSATLPVTMRCAQKNLGVSKDVAGFVLPLGATINMDGTALYQGVSALFVAQVYGIALVPGQYAAIILTATLASIGTAGVPGAGLIMLTLVLQQAGLPLEGIALLAGVDRILDMGRTSINVAGDLCVATVVAASEGELGLVADTAPCSNSDQ